MKINLLAFAAAAAVLLSGCGSSDQSSDQSSDSSSRIVTASKQTTTSKTTTISKATTTYKTTAASKTTARSVTEQKTDPVSTKAVIGNVTDDSQPVKKNSSDSTVRDRTPRFGEYNETTVNVSAKGSYTEMDSIDYYYNTIDDFHKFMYIAMYDVCIHGGQKDYKAYINIPQELIWDFSDDFYMTFACLMDDYPEFYYFDEQAGLSWDYADKNPNNGYYRVYIYQSEDFPKFEKEQEELKAAAADFLADIDLTGSEYDVALRVHDKLLDTVVFDETEKEENDSKDFKYVQTAYGALVNHKAVCEGYADALSYLLRWCGIMCLPIEGSAGSGSTYDEAMENASSGYHAWNLMRLDGKFSETDPSWDDFKEDDYSKYTLSLIKKVPGLLEKSKHIYWNISIPEMRDLRLRDEFIYYTDSDGKTYSLAHDCVIHLRSNDPRCPYYSNSGSYNYKALADMLPEK